MLGFEHTHEMYEHDDDFSAIYALTHTTPHDRFCQDDRYLFFDGKLRVPICSLHELLMMETLNGDLMGHFGVTKTLNIL